METQRRRALILTYYWPPAGGSGVQRWLKFVKYLGTFGWNTVIYTAKDPEAPAYDNNLLNDIPKGTEIIRRKAIEPFKLFRFITKSKGGMGAGFAVDGGQKQGWIFRVSLWIRSNIFIPDARAFWVQPSIKYLTKWLKNNSVDIIVSTGPPHSMHLTAMELNKRTGIPWIADFRDPWTNIDYFQDLLLTPLARKKHHTLEHNVINSANCLVVVSNQMKSEFEKISTKRIEVITNGYDEADFSKMDGEHDPLFSITHVGTLPANRNCTALWNALQHFTDTNKEFASSLRINLVGKVDAEVLASIKENKLEGYCQYHGYVSHNKGIALMQRSRILLLIINNSPNAAGILTGKVFEYLGAKRPILALGIPGGDVDKLLQQTKAGYLLPFHDTNAIYNGLQRFWDNYKDPNHTFSTSGTERYSRRSLAERMARVMGECLCLRV